MKLLHIHRQKDFLMGCLEEHFLTLLANLLQDCYRICLSTTHTKAHALFLSSVVWKQEYWHVTILQLNICPDKGDAIFLKLKKILQNRRYWGIEGLTT